MFIILAGPRVAHAACPPEITPITVMFVNGMWTNSDDAEASYQQLKTAVTSDARWFPELSECVTFTYRYNRLTVLGVGDLYQVYVQYFASNLSGFLRTISGLIEPSKEDSDTLVALSQRVDIEGCFATGKDCSNLLADIDGLLATKHERLIIVPHSQGNFYANEIYDNLIGAGKYSPDAYAIVGVATPDSHSRDTGSYINMKDDPVAALSGLPWTAEDRKDCFAFGCHSFVKSYLAGPDARSQILDAVYSLLPAPPPFATSITLAGVALDTGTHLHLTPSEEPVVFTAAATGTILSEQWLVNGDSQGSDLSMTFTRPPGSYEVSLLAFGESGKSDTDTITVIVDPPTVNSAPVADFVVAEGMHSAAAPGGVLNATADPLTGEASVTFTDHSNDPDGLGDITSRVWSVNTQSAPLCVDTSTCVWGFEPGGPYIITLTISDTAGHTSSATATVNVAPATTVDIAHLLNSGEFVPAGSADPRWTLLSGPSCPLGNCPAIATGGDSFSRALLPNTDATDPAGDYTYRLLFNVSSSELATAHISGRWAVDDQGLDIRINGVSTGQQSHTTFGFAQFDIASGFVVGTNTLDFVVHNQDCASCPINPVSLRVEFRDRPREGIWPVSGRDPQRSGRSEFLAPTLAPTGPAWTFSTTAPVVGDLVVGSDQTVYFVSDDLYALNPDGSVKARGSSVATGPFITGPAVDEHNGYVYVGRGTASAWQVLRFDRVLSTETVVMSGTGGVPSSLIVDDGTLFFFTTSASSTVGGKAYAIGGENWVSDACATRGFVGPATPGGWLKAPSLGLDGSVYGVCSVIADGFSVGSAVLVKLDRSTGTVSSYAAYGTLGTVELSVDGNGFIHTGYIGFGGASFFGSYDRFDVNLNHATSEPAYTSSRSAFYPDTTSSVRIADDFFSGMGVSSEGTYHWDISLSPGVGHIAVPTVDRNGAVLVADGPSLVELRGQDGSIVWAIPVTGDISAQPVIAGDGVVYVATSAGTVFKFVK